MVKSLASRMPNSPIWRSSPPVASLARSRFDVPDSSAASVMVAAGNDVVRQDQTGDEDLGFAAGGWSDEEEPDRVAVGAGWR